MRLYFSEDNVNLDLPIHVYHRSVYGQVGMYHDDIEQDDFMAIIEQAATYARGMVRRQ